MMLSRYDIGLLSTLVIQHMQKLRQRRGESPADFEFRREGYKPLLRKLEKMYEGTDTAVPNLAGVNVIKEMLRDE